MLCNPSDLKKERSSDVVKSGAPSSQGKRLARKSPAKYVVGREDVGGQLGGVSPERRDWEVARVDGAGVPVDLDGADALVAGGAHPEVEAADSGEQVKEPHASPPPSTTR